MSVLCVIKWISVPHASSKAGACRLLILTLLAQGCCDRNDDGDDIGNHLNQVGDVPGTM